MTKLGIQGHWNQIKGKAKQKWAQLTDDALLLIEGREEELLGQIQEKSGETKQNLRNLISRL